MADAILTAERLRELLHYDPETGVFTWRSDRGIKAKAGQVAGSVYSHGYTMIGIDYRYIGAHRLAWLYVHGSMPKHVIDHINGIRTDNRIANLRDVTQRVNSQNRKVAMSNNTTSGLLGVCWDKWNRRWKTQIKDGAKYKSLGAFATAEEAHEAYVQAKRRLHEGCTI